jgi:hypothetical protein
MASDVLGAFKILISSQPQDATAAFKAIIDGAQDSESAIEKLSTVLTGINSAFELVGKAAGFFAEIGGAMIDAGKAGLEFLSAGGDYKEQSFQIAALADSYGMSSKEIMDALDDVTDSNISFKDSMDMTAKAVNTGLSMDNLKVLFEYSKKLSEADLSLGGFTATYDKLVKSLEKGGGEGLEKFGLSLGKAASSAEIIAAMKDGLTAFGDAGFNAADRIGAINEKLSLFYVEAGKAANQSLTLQSAFNVAKDTVVDFVKSFDYRQIAYFVEVVFSAGKEIVKALMPEGVSNLFTDLGKTFKSAFSDGGQIAKDVIAWVVSGLGDIILFSQTMYNALLGGIASVADGIEWLFTTGRTKFGELIEFFGTQIGNLSVQFGVIIGKFGEAIEKTAINSPSISKMFGFDEDSAKPLYDLQNILVDMGKSVKTNLSEVGKEMVTTSTYTKEWGNSIRGAQFDVSKTAETTEKLKQAILGIDYKAGVEGAQQLKGAIEGAGDANSKFGSQQKELADAEKKRKQEEKEAEKDKEKEEKEAREREKEASKQRIEEFKAEVDAKSKGIVAIGTSIDSLTQAWAKAVEIGDIKVATELNTARKAEIEKRDSLIEDLKNATDRIADIDWAKKIGELQMIVEVKGDDILKQLFDKAVIYAQAEGTVVAGV